MKNRFLIFGKGYMGQRIAEALDAPVSQRRILTFRDADDEVARHDPRVMVNCIGHTGGKNVDGCEEDKDRTLSANTFVPILLAEAALRRKVRLVHISSGCIYQFDYKRDKPISEEKSPDFFDLFYSRTKIYTEKALEALAARYGILIARIRIPLDNRPHPRNILTKLLGFKKVIDAPNSVTYIPDFIRALKYMIKNDARGIYNVVNRGGLRYPDLLDVYKKYVPDFKYEAMDHKELGLVRTNLVMSTQKLQRLGFKIRPISEVLEECVTTYLKY